VTRVDWTCATERHGPTPEQTLCHILYAEAMFHLRKRTTFADNPDEEITMGPRGRLRLRLPPRCAALATYMIYTVVLSLWTGAVGQQHPEQVTDAGGMPAVAAQTAAASTDRIPTLGYDRSRWCSAPRYVMYNQQCGKCRSTCQPGICI
jgi:hypothetical protein